MNELDKSRLTSALSLADKETLVEIVREAEKHLDAQLASALAADQRALTLASICGAVVAILVGALTSMFASENVKFTIYWLPVFGIVFSFVVAMILSIRAVHPTDFHFSGNDPENWIADVKGGQTLIQSLAEQAILCSDSIKQNDEIMRANTKKVEAALEVLWYGLTLSTLAGGILLIPAVELFLF